jgi:hypothetical protein
MNATKSTKKVAAQQRSEPRLPRKALLAILDDRKTVVALVQRRPYTMISIISWYNDTQYGGIGFSKVCYPDKWDDEHGADIASRRALIEVFHQVRVDEDVELFNLVPFPEFDDDLDDFKESLLDEIPF